MECINKIKHNLVGLSLVACLFFTITVYAVDESQDSATTTDSIHFHVSYKSKVEPLPLNRIHSWILHVDTLDGKPVEKAVITVFGGMPAHTHGLPTQPEVTEIGDGDYLVEGLKFSMTGIWYLWFNIRAGDVTDKIKFDIEF